MSTAVSAFSVCPTGPLLSALRFRMCRSPNDPEKGLLWRRSRRRVRVAIGEEFGLGARSWARGQMVASRRNCNFAGFRHKLCRRSSRPLEEPTNFWSGCKSGREAPVHILLSPVGQSMLEQSIRTFGPASSRRSPQQMFGSVAKRFLAKELGVEPQNLLVCPLCPVYSQKVRS